MKLVRKEVMKWKNTRQLNKLKQQIRQEIIEEIQTVCKSCLNFNRIEDIIYGKE